MTRFRNSRLRTGFHQSRSIQIAVPADAMFPPGALPDGITSTADVSIARMVRALLRLRPRLIGFERSTLNHEIRLDLILPFRLAHLRRIQPTQCSFKKP